MERQLFGKEIKRLRKEKKISQYSLAEGICSQSMLSAIETGKYLPNAQIIVKLCNRLDLDTDLLVLHDHYEISAVGKFSEKCEQLCNRHSYMELYHFLNKKSVLDSIETRQQMQAYYYYLACSQFHLDKDKTESLRSFRLSLSERDTSPNAISMLSLMSVAVIFSELGKEKSTESSIEEAIHGIHEVDYEKNLNILFYLQAYAYFKLNLFSKAYSTLEKGIEFITSHDSHFMLGNLFFLAAKVAEQAEQENQQRESKQQSEIFEKLFGEKIFKNIS